MFPRVDVKRFNITDDARFMLDLLRSERILFIQGSGFNWPAPDHFRVVFLPTVEELREAFGKIGKFLETYQQGVKNMG
jgi:alanine-synthesizing transaminase